VSTDHEAYTYNKRVNRLATIQEHKMILKAVERGRLRGAHREGTLNMDVASIKRKRHLLEGIGVEVAELLKDKHIGIQTL